MLTHKGTQTIETSRLVLRQARREDAEAMFRNWASDPEVTKFLTWPTHDTADVSQWVIDSWIRDYGKADFYQWMIVLKELGEPIGSISVTNVTENTGALEIGYCIGRAWWRKGIVSEALQAVMEFLFAQVCALRLEAKHDVCNPNSGLVMKKCGMRFEGIARSGGRNNQGICDIATYAILRSDLRP